MAITAAALVERMRTEATTWINAVHMQHRRVVDPIVNPEAPGEEVWHQAIDLHFLLIALTRLRRSVNLAAQVQALQDRLLEHLTTFDQHIPSLRKLRNVAEHFDDYTIGEGCLTQTERYQLQTWSLGEDATKGLVWDWLDVEFPVDAAHHAATVLYRSFLTDANKYLANDHS
jgi:hypothetical protein